MGQKQLMKPQQCLCERPSGIGPNFWFLDYGCSYWIDRGIPVADQRSCIRYQSPCETPTSGRGVGGVGDEKCLSRLILSTTEIQCN